MNGDDLVNLAIIVAVVALIAYMRKKNDVGPKIECKQHQWEHQEQPGMDGYGYHMCKKCKKIPGHLDD